MHRISTLATNAIAQNLGLERSIPYRLPLPAPTIDSFEVRVKSKNIELFSKVTKAMRAQVQSDPIDNGFLKLKQVFSSNDIKKLASLEKADMVKSYLEGVYVAERYCALVDKNSAAQRNAIRFMADYKAHIKKGRKQRKYDEDLQWIKKDYAAGTGGENIEKDAKLIGRAKHFYHELHYKEHDEKSLKHVIQKDENPLAAFIAMRRAIFAYDEGH